MCSLKLNTALFNWSDFTYNCMILSTTFGFHFVWISGLISESILKINQYGILNIEVQKWNNWENVNLLWIAGAVIINKNSNPTMTAPVGDKAKTDEWFIIFLFLCSKLPHYIHYINKNRVGVPRVPDLLEHPWLQPPWWKAHTNIRNSEPLLSNFRQLWHRGDLCLLLSKRRRKKKQQHSFFFLSLVVKISLLSSIAVTPCPLQ